MNVDLDVTQVDVSQQQQEQQQQVPRLQSAGSSSSLRLTSSGSRPATIHEESDP